MNFFQKTPAVPEVSQIRVDPSTSEFYVRKHALDRRDQNILTEEKLCSYAAGDWVLVTYDDGNQPYPGEITEVHESSLRIKVMERTGGNFKWPKREDIIYAMGNVVKSLNQPTVVGKRGQLNFMLFITTSVDSFAIL